MGKTDRLVLLTEGGEISNFLGRLAADTRMTAGIILVVMALVFAVLVGVAAGHKNAPPAAVLVVVAGMAATAGAASAGLIATSRGVELSKVKFAYAYYPEALAYFDSGHWRVIGWQEVREYHAPTMVSPFALVVLRNGDTVPLRRGIRFASGGVYEEVVARLARIEGTNLIADPLQQDPQRWQLRAVVYGLPIVVGGLLALFGGDSVVRGTGAPVRVLGAVALVTGVVMAVGERLGFSFFPNDGSPTSPIKRR